MKIFNTKVSVLTLRKKNTATVVCVCLAVDGLSTWVDQVQVVKECLSSCLRLCASCSWDLLAEVVGSIPKMCGDVEVSLNCMTGLVMLLQKKVVCHKEKNCWKKDSVSFCMTINVIAHNLKEGVRQLIEGTHVEQLYLVREHVVTNRNRVQRALS